MKRFTLALASVLLALPLSAAELSVDDFKFDGPLGSDGARIEKIAANHFKITLGHTPNQPTWANRLQFQILRNARGNSLRIDAVFPGGNAFAFHEYFHSFSYDARNWTPIQFTNKSTTNGSSATLQFPAFAQDTVYLGHQVPMSYEDTLALIDQWKKHPAVKVHVLGQSLAGRDIHRIEIADPQGLPRKDRWVHYVANQHPGEHNAQWRMVGMIDWLLSDAGADFRRRSICHFILTMSPDAPSNGWYRTGRQGADLNRAYLPDGADPHKQPHEAYVCQKDLEALMAGDCPITSIWTMHTWGGIVEPIVTPGPEMGAVCGPWTELRDILQRNDTRKLIKPLALRTESKLGFVTWTAGPNKRYGMTVVLVEGAGAIDNQPDNLESGVALMKSIAEYYRGQRR